MSTLKIISFILVFSTYFLTGNYLVAQTAQCGGSNSASFIRSDVANVNALMIYTYFPSGGFSGTSDIPSFALIAAQHHSDYYDEMSYDTHHIQAGQFTQSNKLVLVK